MATILCNGVFDLLHPGHQLFLSLAKGLGYRHGFTRYPDHEPCNRNRLIVAVNSDRSARELKAAKWGEKYPVMSEVQRMAATNDYADEIWCFDTEAELHTLIQASVPCIIVKGPDYIGKRVTGDDIAPVIILDTPETDEVRELKRKAYML